MKILLFFLSLPILLFILLNIASKPTTGVNRHYVVNTIIVILFAILVIYSIPIILFHDFDFKGPLKMITGVGVYKPYYIYIRLFLLGLIIYLLINFRLGEINWDTAKSWTFIIMVVATIMGIKHYYFHNVHIPKKEKAREAIIVTKTKSVVKGEKLVIRLKPHQKIVVDKINRHKRFQFISFTGPLMVRVNNGNSQCWSVVENTLPWWAYRSGKLEVKAGNMPVTFTIIIEK